MRSTRPSGSKLANSKPAGATALTTFSAVLTRCLNNSIGRWLLLLVAVLTWFYSIMVGLAGRDFFVASFLALLLAAFVLYVACVAYDAMRYNKRSHLHIWLKVGGYLLATGLFIILNPWWGVICTTLATFVLYLTYFTPTTNKVAEEGAYADQDARRIAAAMDKVRPQDDNGFYFGGVWIPGRSATKHTLFIGTTGSGKSVSQKLIMKDIYPAIMQCAQQNRAQQQLALSPRSSAATTTADSKLTSYGDNKRALVYDPANEWPSVLKAMKVPGWAVINTNPFRTDCRPWHLALDIQTATEAIALAEILVPMPDNCSDTFWIDCTRLLLAAVVRYFNAVATGQYRLRDLLLAARDQTLVAKMMEDDDRLRHFLQVRGSDKTAQNIASTTVSVVTKTEVIGALWHKSETVYGNKPFSLQDDFINDSTILLLSRSATAGPVLREINRILLARCIQLLMDQPEVDDVVTTLSVDELGSLGKSKEMVTALTELRKRGVAVLAGIQSIHHLIDNYGEHLARTILAQFGHIGALRCSDHLTEDWLVKIWGKVRFKRQTVSETSSFRQGKSYTTAVQYGEEDALRPGSLSAIPEFDPALGVGLTGYYSSGHQRWQHTYPPSIVQYLPPKGDPSDNLNDMPKQYQELDPWRYQDLVRLNITHLFDGPIDVVPEDGGFLMNGNAQTTTLGSAAVGTTPPVQPQQPLDRRDGIADDMEPAADSLQRRLEELGNQSASDYLENQFAKFEEVYGINLNGDEPDRTDLYEKPFIDIDGDGVDDLEDGGDSVSPVIDH